MWMLKITSHWANLSSLTTTDCNHLLRKELNYSKKMLPIPNSLVGYPVKYYDWWYQNLHYPTQVPRKSLRKITKATSAACWSLNSHCKMPWWFVSFRMLGTWYVTAVLTFFLQKERLESVGFDLLIASWKVTSELLATPLHAGSCHGLPVLWRWGRQEWETGVARVLRMLTLF